MKVLLLTKNISVDFKKPRGIEVAGELLGGAQNRLCLSEGHQGFMVSLGGPKRPKNQSWETVRKQLMLALGNITIMPYRIKNMSI